jgi:sugar transferase (PEP-CTERM/EpsH1 system associated)
VDTVRFQPGGTDRDWQGPEGFLPDRAVVVGTVGRMQTVKDQLTLVRAFLHLIESEPSARQRLRLVMIGSGPLRDQAERLLSGAGAGHLAWLPGERADVSEVLRSMDVFVLPSLREGLSNAILEAMATGLPVVATRVGGNPELVEEGKTGQLVPPSEPAAMAAAIGLYLTRPEIMRTHGDAGRKRVEAMFSIESMLQGYMAVYDSVLASHRLRIAS